MPAAKLTHTYTKKKIPETLTRTNTNKTCTVYFDTVVSDTHFNPDLMLNSSTLCLAWVHLSTQTDYATAKRSQP